MKAEIATGIDGLLEIQSAWNELFSVSLNKAFYNDWRWHAAVARHLIRTDLHYLTVHDAAKLVAIFPVHRVRRSYLGVPVGFTALPAHPHLVLGDALIHPDHLGKPLWDFVLNRLQKQEVFSWSIARFAGFTRESNLGRLLRGTDAPARVVGRSYYARFRADSSQRIWASARKLRNVRRLEARAREGYGDVVMRIVEDPDRILEAFRQFARIEASGWKGRGGVNSAIDLNPSLVAFYEEVLTAFAATMQSKIALLQVGDPYVAGHLALKSGDTQYLLKISYDEAYEHIGPGSILMKEVLSDCAEVFGELNLLTAPKWADRWHLDSESVWEAEFYNETPAASILRAVKSTSAKLRRQAQSQP